MYHEYERLFHDKLSSWEILLPQKKKILCVGKIVNHLLNRILHFFSLSIYLSLYSQIKKLSTWWVKLNMKLNMETHWCMILWILLVSNMNKDKDSSTIIFSFLPYCALSYCLYNYYWHFYYLAIPCFWYIIYLTLLPLLL